MYSPRVKIKNVPAEYEFPYVPYDIQQNLMKSLYHVIENKGIGIFESPTGTGKSLALTSAALRWLEDHEELVCQDLQNHIDDIKRKIIKVQESEAITEDWISSQYIVIQEREILMELQRLQTLLEKYEKQLVDLKERVAPSQMNEDTKTIDVDDEIVQEESFHPVQIFYCSRTHSQLAQVVHEVQRTTYGKRIRCISLASRHQLCINPTVKQLPSALLNERCLDMVKSTHTVDDKTVKQQKHSICPFKSATNLQKLSDAALMDIMDIEELVSEGARHKACPYYAARGATKMAQLIMLPYQLLLHRRTRLQAGLDLRGAVIIIDEAHNLLDTIVQLHSSEVSLEQLRLSLGQLVTYKQRFVKRFSTTNLLRINQLIFVVKRLIKILESPTTSNCGNNPTSVSRFLRSYELTAEGEFFNIDLFQLVEFCEQNRLAQKLQNIVVKDGDLMGKENISPKCSSTTELLQRIQDSQTKVKERSKKEPLLVINSDEKKVSNFPSPVISTPSVIRPLIAFLESLTDKAEDGRVLVCCDASAAGSKSYFKYVLLNPSEYFQDILNEARAVIVAGGTMQPTLELTQQLFRTCVNRVQEFSYGHVVPPDAVAPFVVSRGPTGQRMLFNFSQRGDERMLSELAMIFQNICNVVPEGVVCFLPSYDFLDTVYTHLINSKVVERIGVKKVIFRESRSAANGQTVEQLLAQYTATIKSGKGAFLFSVVGGKLSEGLNFADSLGRAVIVVGMPYPNRQSAELNERMKYLDSTIGKGAGSEYYENLCMKAVNQCIGRSVRHVKDYACVFLLDERYNTERIQQKLPRWITHSLQAPTTFGAIQAATAKFFKHKRLL